MTIIRADLWNNRSYFKESPWFSAREDVMEYMPFWGESGSSGRWGEMLDKQKRSFVWVVTAVSHGTLTKEFSLNPKSSYFTQYHAARFSCMRYIYSGVVLVHDHMGFSMHITHEITSQVSFVKSWGFFLDSWYMHWFRWVKGGTIQHAMQGNQRPPIIVSLVS